VDLASTRTDKEYSTAVASLDLTDRQRASTTPPLCLRPRAQIQAGRQQLELIALPPVWRGMLAVFDKGRGATVAYKQWKSGQAGRIKAAPVIVKNTQRARLQAFQAQRR
jgi:hypothetical protein